MTRNGKFRVHLKTEQEPILRPLKKRYSLNYYPMDIAHQFLGIVNEKQVFCYSSNIKSDCCD